MRFFIVTTEPFRELHFNEPKRTRVGSLLACQSNKNRSVKERFFYALPAFINNVAAKSPLQQKQEHPAEGIYSTIPIAYQATYDH